MTVKRLLALGGSWCAGVPSVQILRIMEHVRDFWKSISRHCLYCYSLHATDHLVSLFLSLSEAALFLDRILFFVVAP